MHNSTTTMKLLASSLWLALAALSFSSTNAAGPWKVEKIQDYRALSGTNSNFLISNASPPDQPLCITVVDDGSLRNVANLKLEHCNFEMFPSNQLWSFEDGKLLNGLGSGNAKCMVVNHGVSLFDGVRMRLADCVKNSLNEFVFDGEYIRIAVNTGYCLANRGTRAQAGDTILAKPCQDVNTFKWNHKNEDPRNDGGTLYSFFAEGGCIQPKNGSTEKFTPIIMDNCDDARAWNVKEMNGVKIFRNRLDLSMCLQAGLGGYVDHGTKLRLMPCKEMERLQHFEWSDETPIKLANREEYEADVCAEWRGRNVNVGVDPVIMKTCDLTVWTGWSGDEVFY